MQKARSHPYKYRLLPLVSYRFQVLFHSPPGVLFTFPSRYFSTIGHYTVFSLGWWSTRIPAGFLVSDCTQDTRLIQLNADYGAFTLFGVTSQRLLLEICIIMQVLQPHSSTLLWFGLVQFRSPLLPESRLISFPRGTKMVQFPRCRFDRL